MAALRDSVIVIDEVQSVPPHHAVPIQYGAELFERFSRSDDPALFRHTALPGADGASVSFGSILSDLVGLMTPLWKAFRRTEIFDRRIPGAIPRKNWRAFVSVLRRRAGSVLLICNTTAGGAGAVSTAAAAARNVPSFHRHVYGTPPSDTASHSCGAARSRKEWSVFPPSWSKPGSIFPLAVWDSDFGGDGQCGAGGGPLQPKRRTCEREPVYLVNLREERSQPPAGNLAGPKAAESLLADFAENPGRL